MGHGADGLGGPLLYCHVAHSLLRRPDRVHVPKQDQRRLLSGHSSYYAGRFSPEVGYPLLNATGVGCD